MKRPTAAARPPRVARIGFCLLFALIPLVMDSDLYTLTLMPRRILIQFGAFAILGAVLLDLRARRITLELDRTVTPPLLLFLLIGTLSILAASHRLAALDAVTHQLTFVAVFFAATWAFPPGALISAFRVTASVGILVSAIGIAEFLGVDFSSLITSNGPPSATFAYRNFAAAWLILALPQAVALFLKPDRDRDRALGAVSTVLMCVFLSYTRTRGAWVGLLGALIVAAAYVMLTRHPDRRFGIRPIRGSGRWLLLAGVLATIALTLLPPRIAPSQGRHLDEGKASLAASLTSTGGAGGDRGRLAMWRGTMEMISDHPLGVGAGNWHVHYPLYDDGTMLKPGSSPERPHNDYLWIASELGLPGIFVYAWLLAAIALVGWRALKRTHDPHRLPVLALGTGIAATFGHAVFSFPRELAEPSLLLWFGVGVLAAEARTHDARKTPTPPLATGLAYTLPVLLAIAGWVSVRHIQFDAHYQNAHRFHAGGDAHSMLEQASRAIDVGPFRSDIYVLKAKGHQAFGDYRSARSACLNGLECNPNSIGLTSELGIAYAMMDSLPQAEAAMRRVLDLAPSYFQMYNNLGGVYQKGGRLDRAIATYREAIQQSPVYTDAWSNLGLALLEAGQVDEAIAACREAIALSPRDPALYHNLGDALFAKAQSEPALYGEAARAYETFLRTWRGPASQAEQAQSRMREARKRSNP